jgi:hypothetical protein
MNLLCVKMIYNTVLWNVYSILHCKNFVHLCSYVVFHTLMDPRNGVSEWVCVRVCVCVCVWVGGCVCVRMSVGTACVCMYMYKYVCMYLSINVLAGQG